MVIPVAASQQLFTGFRATLLGAMGIGVLAALGDTFGSYHWNTATGATIIRRQIGRASCRERV